MSSKVQQAIKREKEKNRKQISSNIENYCGVGGERRENPSNTFLKRGLFVLFQSLYRNRFKSNTSSWILLQHVPHVLLAQHKQITVADRADAGSTTITYMRRKRFKKNGKLEKTNIALELKTIHSGEAFVKRKTKG